MEQDPNSLVPSSESGNNQDAQIHPKNNGSDNRGQHPAVRYIKVGLSLAFVEAAALFLEHFSDVFHGVFVELANWVSLCLQLLIVAVPISIWVEKRGKTKNWVWILYGLGCLDRKSTRLNSSHRCISHAALCLQKSKRADDALWPGSAIAPSAARVAAITAR